MTLYKLTDAQGRTRGGETNSLQWGPSVTHTAAGEGTRLCSPDVIHAYEDPLLAVLLNPIHANFREPQLWEAEGDVVARDGQLKCGVKTLTTLRLLPLPVLTIAQRVRFAIYCARHSYSSPAFTAWAEKWLSGEDRSRQSALAAYNAAYDAAYDVEAADAAYAAAYAAATAAAAYDAADAYAAAADAAYAAAYAADVEAAADFITLAQRAIADECAYEAQVKR